ncbi:MAG TPA: glycosyltransferase [Candidatus Babeliales bacterium]|jgi:colanic acid/amylovoran biosynthesis glycosyltransferase|nr:glycosyltransferase [Candidatus Babeliales bacterium]
MKNGNNNLKKLCRNIFIKYGFFGFLFLTYTMMLDSHTKKPMKILMVVGTFPKIHDICMLNQITGLIDRGHDVHIYAFSRGDFVHVQEEIITYDLVNKTIFTLPSSFDEYDIVVFQLGHKIFDLRKTHNFKGKIVVCLRGYDITGFLQENPDAYREYFKSCDLFMPVCGAFKKILEDIGCPLHKIIVHHSSIDCSKFKFKLRELPQYGAINILSAGRFVEKKGFVHAIRAIAELIKKYPKIQYTIIGGGILKPKYQKLIKKLRMEKYIHLDHWHTHKEYIDILNNAHFFILPSVIAKNNDQEGIPNVLKEAMAMGLLVVATDHSGNNELIEDGISGCLVPERDSNALAQKIEFLLRNSSHWHAIQLAAAYKIHDEFDKEKENDKLERIFYDLLKKENQKI